MESNRDGVLTKSYMVIVRELDSSFHYRSISVTWSEFISRTGQNDLCGALQIERLELGRMCIALTHSPSHGSMARVA